VPLLCRTAKKPHWRYAARLLKMTAGLRGSAIVSSIGESGNGCIETEQYLEGSGAPVTRREGWPCGNPAATLTAQATAAAWRHSGEKTAKGRPMMPIVTWDHVHLRSPDPEATAAWLENILGGVIVRGPGRIDVKLGGANVFIAPVAAGDGVNSPPATPYQGLDHFGLTVKDIDAVAAEIKAKGVEFTREPTTIRPGVRICFIRGPQGISIELLERDKKYA
jgi:catechol 2,3-dioxygenase-like lactoylglutathione lyase family enzyme